MGSQLRFALFFALVGTAACGSGNETTLTSSAQSGTGASGAGGTMTGGGMAHGGGGASSASTGSGGAGGAGCTTGADCGDGMYCDAGTCKVGCGIDKDCPGGSVCDASHKCVMGCSAQQPCPNGLLCCDGLCADTSGDVAHCGSCDPCPADPSANADPTCVAGMCGYGPCHPGFGDCDLVAANGCEADLMGAMSCVCTPGDKVACYDGPQGTEGVGVCKGGQKTCNFDGQSYGACQGEVLPGTETCNTFVDDDCDGQVNEDGAGCVCKPSEVVPCYDGPPATQNVGTCQDGVKQCNAQGTAFGACIGEVLPAAEDCNQPSDENCDGQVDETCGCTPNTSKSCYGGPPGTLGVGQCKAGTQTCNAQGTGYGPCNGQVLPGQETCNDFVDNDCDGQVNEDGPGCVCVPNSSSSCYDGPPGTQDVGICKAGTQTCNGQGTAYGPCQGEITPQTETCNTPFDDDCNGQVNEGGVGCVCSPGQVQSCYDGPPATDGVGLCQPGTHTCNASGTAFGPCVGEVLPAPETCQTPGDDDCDGLVNEEGQGCGCVPSSTAPCYSGPPATENVGICKGGTATCNAQGTGYGACVGETTPQVETCTTPDDDDCDGQANESGTGCVCKPNASKSCYTGPPGTLGVGVCKSGTSFCNAQGTAWGPCENEITPTPESCNTPGDDDCNGSTLVCTADQACDPGTGQCISACDPKLLGTSYIGCEYWPTVTANNVDPNFFTFAVAVSNTSNKPATVTITQGPNPIANGTVAANSVQIFAMPWVSSLKGPASAPPLYANVGMTNSIRANQGAYKLVSTRPVTVYQYNPLEYKAAQGQGQIYSYTNDASLLLPANAWGTTFRVIAYPFANAVNSTSGYFAVTASADNTVVTLTKGPNTTNVLSGIAGVDGQGNGTVTLNAGDVIELCDGANGSDFSGHLVTSTKPVQIIGGHQVTYVPDNIDADCCADHLQESIPSVDQLSKQYVIIAPWIFANSPRDELVRVVSTQPGTTTLTYDPPQPGAPTTLLGAGTVAVLPINTNAYKITASQKIVVAQYMVGEKYNGGTSGDPSMALAVPVEQYRKSYLFHAPTNYLSNFVNIIAPTNASVILDGVAVNGWVAIGGTGYSYARKQLSNAGNGNHTVTASLAVAISVYGYGDYTSYWYCGGLDLNKIPN